ncbi:hypothetical protein EUX98_g6628 [Antrodiella citrinella]|uniref:glutathione transferase n=1 Tax=Antrodiella citrinella TaxID=2447956 RepID=A0A4S4MNI2_9APHY|nr:hypothetical protein EUX98_g6628 [Antrodiella citrinella]
MVLQIHGSPGSTCTRRVGVVCEELGIPYELVVVNLAKGEQKAPAFLEHQPFGVVPYIVDDDGYELYESRAVVRYLAAKYNSPLFPKPSDLQKWAKFEQAASIEQSNFDVYAAGLAAERVFRPAKGLAGDENVAQRHIEMLSAKLDAYDVILSKQRYLAGDEYTLADLFHLPYGALITKIGIDFLVDETKRPHVARCVINSVARGRPEDYLLTRSSPVDRWWKEISSRPAWQKVKDGLPLKSA